MGFRKEKGTSFQLWEIIECPQRVVGFVIYDSQHRITSNSHGSERVVGKVANQLCSPVAYAKRILCKHS